MKGFTTNSALPLDWRKYADLVSMADSPNWPRMIWKVLLQKVFLHLWTTLRAFQMHTVVQCMYLFPAYWNIFTTVRWNGNSGGVGTTGDSSDVVLIIRLQSWHWALNKRMLWSNSGQKRRILACAVIPVIPWCAECRHSSTSLLSDCGISMHSSLNTTPSSQCKSSFTAQYDRRCSGSYFWKLGTLGDCSIQVSTFSICGTTRSQVMARSRFPDAKLAVRELISPSLMLSDMVWVPVVVIIALDGCEMLHVMPMVYAQW